MKNNQVQTKSTYSGEQHARNEEGETVRRSFERPVSVTLVTTEDKRVFHKGARIA